MFSKVFILFFIGAALSHPLTEGEENVLASTKGDIDDMINQFKEIFDVILEGLKENLLTDVKNVLKYCENVNAIEDIKLADLTFSPLMNETMFEDWEESKDEYKTYEDYQIAAVNRICTSAKKTE